MDLEKIGQTDGTQQRFLNFSLGTEDFALPLLRVKEVIALPDCTPVPHMPNYFIGVINLRGQIISIMDLRKKFNIQSARGADACVIICDLSGLSVGIIVDAINSVIMPQPEDILPKPPVETKISNEYIFGVYRRAENLVMFLDIEKALDLSKFITSTHRKVA